MTLRVEAKGVGMKVQVLAVSWLMAGLASIAWIGSATQVRAQAQSSNEIHQNYDLTPGGTVSVSNVSGHIRVTSWDENRVRVDAVKQGPNSEDFSRVEIQVTARPDAVVIRTLYPGVDADRRGRSPNVTVNYDLKVPRSAVLNSLNSISGEIIVTGPVAQLTARSVSGSVSAQDVQGAVLLSSTSGSITARRVGGARDDTVVNAISGNVILERVAGRAVSRTVSGSISASDIGGDVSAESTSSSVTVENVRGRVTATTFSGNVMVRRAQEGVSARAVNGQIEINDAKGRIDATTTSGGISLLRVDSREVKTKSTSGGVGFQGTIYDDGRYAFESFSGEIIVLVPVGSGFNLTARTYSGAINTEFPIQLLPGVAGERLIRGTAGKGGAEIIASGFSGRIEIKKATATTNR